MINLDVLRDAVKVTATDVGQYMHRGNVLMNGQGLGQKDNAIRICGPKRPTIWLSKLVVVYAVVVT
jgi:hypothetical protein